MLDFLGCKLRKFTFVEITGEGSQSREFNLMRVRIVVEQVLMWFSQHGAWPPMTICIVEECLVATGCSGFQIGELIVESLDQSSCDHRHWRLWKKKFLYWPSSFDYFLLETY